MLIQFSVKKDDVVKAGDGYIIAKVNFHGYLENGGYLFTVEGETIEDFNANDAKCGKSITIGTRGGISLA